MEKTAQQQQQTNKGGGGASTAATLTLLVTAITCAAMGLTDVFGTNFVARKTLSSPGFTISHMESGVLRFIGVNFLSLALNALSILNAEYVVQKTFLQFSMLGNMLYIAALVYDHRKGGDTTFALAGGLVVQILLLLFSMASCYLVPNNEQVREERDVRNIAANANHRALGVIAATFVLSGLLYMFASHPILNLIYSGKLHRLTSFSTWESSLARWLSVTLLHLGFHAYAMTQPSTDRAQGVYLRNHMIGNLLCIGTAAYEWRYNGAHYEGILGLVSMHVCMIAMSLYATGGKNLGLNKGRELASWVAASTTGNKVKAS